MKKLVFIAALFAAVASMGSCKEKKAEKTAAVAAKEYADMIRNNDYDSFVDVIVFDEPATAQTPAEKKAAKKKAAVNPEVKKAHSSTLKAIHKPSVDEKGGIKDVAVTSEKVAPDGQSANVALTNTYNDGTVETVSYALILDDTVWKVKVDNNKEVWRAVANNGDKEVLKIKEGADRDFVKTKDPGEKQFVKEVYKKDGQVEVIKTLESGERYKDVIKGPDVVAPESDKAQAEKDKKAEKKDEKEVKKEVKKEDATKK